jgi:hypothetical protein
MKHKISISHTPKVNWFDKSKQHGIGGVTEPINAVLWLSDEEFKELNKCLMERRKEKGCSAVTALYDFTHSDVCTKHHRYKIWKTFEGISEINYKYLDCIEN